MTDDDAELVALIADGARAMIPVTGSGPQSPPDLHGPNQCSAWGARARLRWNSNGRPNVRALMISTTLSRQLRPIACRRQNKDGLAGHHVYHGLQ
jgi:hypothetical protein